MRKGDLADLTASDVVHRERLITPWETYVIADQRESEWRTVVWEIATLQWGMPAGVLAGGLALNYVSSMRTLSLATSVAVLASVMFGVIALAHVAGRVLWRLGLRSGRSVD